MDQPQDNAPLNMDGEFEVVAAGLNGHVDLIACYFLVRKAPEPDQRGAAVWSLLQPEGGFPSPSILKPRSTTFESMLRDVCDG